MTYKKLIGSISVSVGLVVAMGIASVAFADAPAGSLTISAGSGSPGIAVGTAVGQPWKLYLSSNIPYGNFSLCGTNNKGVQSCTPWGTTDISGNWTGSGSFSAADVGNWTEYVTFPSQNVNTNSVQILVNSAEPATSGGTPATCDNLQLMHGTCVGTPGAKPNPSYCSTGVLPPAPANLTYMSNVQQCSSWSGCSTRNPLSYATLDSANALAASLGATVVANNNPLGDAAFSYNQPQYELVFPNGFSSAAGDIAQSYLTSGGGGILQSICGPAVAAPGATSGTGTTTGTGTGTTGTTTGTGSTSGTGSAGTGTGTSNVCGDVSATLASAFQSLLTLSSTLSSSGSTSPTAVASFQAAITAITKILTDTITCVSAHGVGTGAGTGSGGIGMGTGTGAGTGSGTGSGGGTTIGGGGTGTPAGDFSIQIRQPYNVPAYIDRGQYAEFIVEADPNGYMTGTIDFSQSPTLKSCIGTGSTCAMDPITISQNSLGHLGTFLIKTTSSTPAGTYSVNLTGTWNGKSHSTSGSVVVSSTIADPGIGEVLPGATSSLRYLKVQILKGASWVAWNEAQVYDANGNLLKLSPIGVYNPQLLVDGDISNMWNTNGWPPGYFILDLGSTMKPSRLSMLAQNTPDPANAQYEVDASVDGTNFTPIAKMGGLNVQTTVKWIDLDFVKGTFMVRQ